jgi:NTP pyrophosphatase (non-canonical NTP hydrolase)
MTVLTTETVGQLQLDELVGSVYSVYNSKDEKRSLWDVWMHTNHHASAVAEQIRKQELGDELLNHIADCAMWLFTMIEKLRGQIGIRKPPDTEQESVIRISDTSARMLWKRFPGVCPFCYWRRTGGSEQRGTDPGISEPCNCESFGRQKLTPDQKREHAASLIAFSQEHVTEQPSDVDGWQAMLAKVFGSQLQRLGPPEIALHLLEEMGEVSDALVRTYSYSEKGFTAGEPSWRKFRLEEELCDVLSRLFGLAEVLGRVSERDSRLSGIIWRRYGSDKVGNFVCWKCKEPQCTCPIIIVPMDRSVSDLQALIDSGESAL